MAKIRWLLIKSVGAQGPVQPQAPMDGSGIAGDTFAHPTRKVSQSPGGYMSHSLSH